MEPIIMNSENKLLKNNRVGQSLVNQAVMKAEQVLAIKKLKKIEHIFTSRALC